MKGITYKSNVTKRKVMKRTWLVLVLIICMCFQFMTNLSVSQAAEPAVTYSLHVSDIGWMNYVSNGATGGTTGKALQAEAIKIKISGMKGNIEYRTHLEDYGWTGWQKNDSVSGTTGQGLRMEAIQIKLTGNIAKYYDVYYRAHISDFGWLGWAKNGGTVGSEGCSIPMEAIEIKLVQKNKNTIKTSQSSIKYPALTYKTHVSDIGWQNEVSEGKLAGTTGKALQVEALVIQCKDFFGGNGIKYRAHVENIGWQNWVKSGQTAGTTGKNQQVEAVEIKLDGQLANYFDIQYRVHCEDYGWLEWVENGKMAGTTGQNKQVEAIEIKLVNKTDKKSSSSSEFDPIWPCEKTYNVTTLYRYSSGKEHSTRFKYGIDIGAPKGENVLAVESGTVITSEYSTTSGFGNWIMIQHENGKVSLYAHLNKRSVTKGNIVKKGQVIGQVGNTSAKYTVGAHLHFELGNSNTSGALGDPWAEYYKPKYGKKITIYCSETK